MHNRILKRLLMVAAIGSSGALLLGSTTAGAATTGQAPQWNTPTGLNLVRAAGSETTYYMMNALGSLFTQTSIYGCNLMADNRTCNTGTDGATTDILDDYSRIEFDNGAGIGSSGGIAELCTGTTSGVQQLNFARSSRAVKTADAQGLCPTVAAPTPTSGNPGFNGNGGFSGPIGLQYADDAIAGIDFPFNNTSAIATHTDSATVTSGSFVVQDSSIATSDINRLVTGAGVPANAYVFNVNPATSFQIFVAGAPSAATANGTSVTVGSVSSVVEIGPVANGWRPGDATTCSADAVARTLGTQPAGKCSGAPVSDIDNGPTESGGGVASSVAFRLQCAPGGAGGGTASSDLHLDPITDWGQLNDPTPTTDTAQYTNKNGVLTTITLTKGEEGTGTPIGVPIYVPNVNPKSGTESVWGSFTTCANPDLNTDTSNLVQENDAPQLHDIGFEGAGPSGCLLDGTTQCTSTYLVKQEAVASGSNSNCGPGQSVSCSAYEQTIFPNGTAARDDVYASNLVAATLYYVSYGVSIWQPFTTGSGDYAGAPSGKRTSIDTIGMSQTNETLSTCTVANSCGMIQSAAPSNRILQNVVNPNSVTASTLSFLDWICNTDPNNVAHGFDLTTGSNYNAELTNLIGTTFFFPREDCYSSSRAPSGNAVASSFVPTTRTDNNGDTVNTKTISVAFTSGSSAVTDNATQLAEAGWNVTGTGIPAGTTASPVGICNPVQGVGFTLCNPLTGAAVNATANGTVLTVTAANS